MNPRDMVCGGGRVKVVRPAAPASTLTRPPPPGTLRLGFHRGEFVAARDWKRKHDGSKVAALREWPAGARPLGRGSACFLPPMIRGFASFRVDANLLPSFQGDNPIWQLE